MAHHIALLIPLLRPPRRRALLLAATMRAALPLLAPQATLLILAPQTALLMLAPQAALLMLAPQAALGADCAAEAAALTYDAAQLPKEELANPGDRENTCITLEVNMDFAARMADHLRACPSSPLAGASAAWAQRGARDADAFKRRRCRRSY